MKKKVLLLFSIVLAALFWFVMFSPWTAQYIHFWYTMLAATAVLTGLSLVFADEWREQLRLRFGDVALGVASAVVLWCIFYLGNEIAGILFDFSKAQVGAVHSLKEGHSKFALILALLFWIGPAEEIFWRGYVQRSLESSRGRIGAFVITTFVYTIVHIWAFNFMLIMAALVCGAFWGWLYAQKRNLALVVVSHAVWDVLIFIVLPIT